MNKLGTTGAGLHPVNDRVLRAARAWRGACEPSSKELSLARHMAHAGAPWHQIAEALNWNCTEITVKARLKKFNIILRYHRKKKERISARFTAIRHFPREESVNVKSYRPKVIRAQV